MSVHTGEADRKYFQLPNLFEDLPESSAGVFDTDTVISRELDL